MVRRLYSLIHRCVYRFKRIVGIVHTKWRLIGNGVEYENYRIVGTPILEISGNGKIVFGNNIQMNNGLLDNQIGYNTPCIFRAENGSITIGEDVGLSQTTMVAKDADISIGNDVKIGGGVKIYTTDFHSLNFKERRNVEDDFRYRKSASITIEDDCFIGAGVIILKGVTIGARSVIGAGSVVVKSLPPDCIAAGNPCKVIKFCKK